MISLEAKSQTTSSPIGLSTTDISKDKPTVSFSDLLHGAKDSKNNKNIQNGTFVLALDAGAEDPKALKLSSDKDTLRSLLKSDEKSLEVDIKSLKEDVKSLELNPKVTKDLSTAELKTLVSDAKRFLKDKIINSDDFKRAEVKDLPKTLKGLAEMATKFGVDLSKITLEEVRVTPKTPIAKEVQSQVKVSSQENVEVKTTTKETKKVELDADDVVEVKTKTVKTKTTKAQVEQDVMQETKVKEDVKDTIRTNDKRADVIKEVKGTPLFKAQEKTELTTEQIVQTKQFKVEDKTPKSKADETLKLLLRGEKPTSISANTNANMTADFSVATARVIAPSATTELTKSFEQLLHTSPEESVSKTDGLTAHKADSFEVKLNEAKQMIKYLSQDVKTAIEDYKSPFTRVKVQLNPHKMGEVDVTIVQRGKNLLVNITSNTAAINTLALNANELKGQLNTNGINNASLNFNNSSQNSEQQASHQRQNGQNEKKADEEYNYFDKDEQNEEILSSLEIVVPNYA